MIKASIFFSEQFVLCWFSNIFVFLEWNLLLYYINGIRLCILINLMNAIQITERLCILINLMNAIQITENAFSLKIFCKALDEVQKF